MLIKVFGSNDCTHCLKTMSTLKSGNIDFEYIDANAEENQLLCDTISVNELPHLQILTKNGEVLVEHAGAMDDNFLLRLVRIAGRIDEVE